MNGVTYLSEEYGTDLAIVSFPGEYGQDGAQAPRRPPRRWGSKIVYDGEGAVVPGADQTPVITELVNSGADIVWATVNPTTLAEIMGGAAAQGFTAHWSGNSPTYGYQAPRDRSGRCLRRVLDALRPTRSCGTSADSPRHEGVVAAMREKRPDAPLGVADVLHPRRGSKG